jgi:DNA helicase-4
MSSGREEESTLFCVGDYRQNVFSFAGSNVNNILDFDESFPYSEKTTLSTNYRCPRNVVEASNAIMIGRKDREARVVAASTQIHPIRVIEKTDKTRYEDWELLSAKELLLELLGKKKVDEEILVLARYNFRLEDLRMAFPDHDKNGLSFKSIHSAKGTEADHVLLLGCVGGVFGFPSNIIEEDLLDVVNKRKQNTNEKLEEERRLFYVALTRCKNQLYLFTSKNDRSQFLSEIESFLHTNPSSDQTSPSGEPHTWRDGYCIRSHHKIRFNAEKPFCRTCFYRWNRYKKRDYAEKYCHSCGERATTTFVNPLCLDCQRKLNQSHQI